MKIIKQTIMKKIIKVNLLILSVLSIVLFVNNVFGQNSYNFNDGIAKAGAENKKILVSIYSPGDSWCNKMESVYSNDKISSLISFSIPLFSVLPLLACSLVSLRQLKVLMR